MRKVKKKGREAWGWPSSWFGKTCLFPGKVLNSQRGPVIWPVNAFNGHSNLTELAQNNFLSKEFNNVLFNF